MNELLNSTRGQRDGSARRPDLKAEVRADADWPDLDPADLDVEFAQLNDVRNEPRLGLAAADDDAGIAAFLAEEFADVKASADNAPAEATPTAPLDADALRTEDQRRVAEPRPSAADPGQPSSVDADGVGDAAPTALPTAALAADDQTAELIAAAVELSAAPPDAGVALAVAELPQTAAARDLAPEPERASERDPEPAPYGAALAVPALDAQGTTESRPDQSPAVDQAPDEQVPQQQAPEQPAEQPAEDQHGLLEQRLPSSPEARVIDYLQTRGKLPAGDLARARKLAEDSGDPLRAMLVRLGLVSDRDMAAAMASVLDLDLIEADDYPDEPVAEDSLSLRFLKDARLVPLREDAEGLEIAAADPVDSFAMQAVEMAAGRPVRLRVGLANEIDAALERLYAAPKDPLADTDLEADLGNFSEEDIEHLRDLASEAPVIRLVNQIMQRAVELRASDVHIEPFADELKVRYRVDGILKESESPPVRSTAAVISRVKIMSKLNIAERRLPQDGRIPLRIQGRELDLRVSTVPTMFGESVVMRLLDKESVSFDFDALGFDGPPRERVIKILEQPFGIFLVTGPTGSGKSTTLYTALSRLNTEDRKIITVEDPVEYQVPGINQIPVKASIGMTFAHALRAIVRQDPDIIMVGEMRDLETARIAVQFALTGHVVLSTLHTNDAASGVTRLLDMGVEDYLLTSTINGILAQRLVRRLCPHCREPYQPMPEMAARFLHLPTTGDGPLTLYRPGGCAACNGTGYRGRLVIAEVLLMTDQIRQAVLRHATASEIQRIAVDQDMMTMYQDGLRKAAAGLTTVEEVLRVAEDT
jgi:general secretion pathway protein E